MRIFSLLAAEGAGRWKGLAWMSVLSAAAIVAMLGVVGVAAQAAAQASTEGGTSLRLLLMFVLSVALFAITHAQVSKVATRIIEGVIGRLRREVFDDIRRSDLVSIEAIGRATLHDTLVSDTQTLARTLPLLVIGAQQAALLAFLGLYLAILSPAAFILAFGATATILLVRMARVQALGQATRAAKASEMRVFDGLTDLLRGFREARMSHARTEALLQSVKAASTEARRVNTTAKARWGREYAILQGLSYGLVGLVVFVAPFFSADYAKVVAPATVAALFVVGPLGTVAQIIPMLGETETALNQIETLRARLRREGEERGVEEEVGGEPPVRLAAIGLNGATFVYRDEAGQPGFSVGPLTARFAAGEIAFVTGGNGAGKSTMLRLLTGLLAPEAGEVTWNDQPVAPARRQGHRDQFAAVFSDYHLSRRLYGLDEPDADEVVRLLDEMDLADKTVLREGRFSTVDLSSGQKKRLALLAARLERKPVLVLDELAADQDPRMRRWFYESLLPALKAEGRVVVCATHDDRWFHLADRLYVMEEGRLREIGAPVRERLDS